MAISKEVISCIVNFYPGGKETARKRVYKDLGEVAGKRLVYGICRYPQRVISLPEEPLLPNYTEQPTLAIVEESGLVPLAYPTDVRALGDELAVKVADYLTAIKERLKATA